MFFPKRINLKQLLSSSFIIFVFFAFASFLYKNESCTEEDSKALHLKDSIQCTLDNLVPQLLIQNNLPGIAIGVIQHGNVSFTKGYGDADLRAKKPIQERTRLNIGSVSKTVTSWGEMVLAD